MRNAAISNVIVDILMLMAAVVIAAVGLVIGQAMCFLVTAVMFVLTGQ